MASSLSFLPVRLAAVMALLLSAPLFGVGQEPHTTRPASPAEPSQPVPVLKINTRMVTLQVVVRDRQGHPVQGLTAKDFQVFEEAPPKNDKRLQKIASFESVSAATVPAAGKHSVEIPAGIYSNLVSSPKTSVPPTVLLIDGINTPVEDQLQVHRQMVKLLASIPVDTPVAVFLLGRQLRMLQDFTTDPRQLIEAANKASSLDSKGLADLDPRDDPTSLAALLEEAAAETNHHSPGSGRGGESDSLANDPGAKPLSSVQLAELFLQEVYAVEMDVRVEATVDALRSLARHLSGYEGRKNLLWISTSFPVQLGLDEDRTLGTSISGSRHYNERIVEVARALSDAKIAVYPVDPSGVQTEHFFQASNPVGSRMMPGRTAFADSMHRENTDRISRQASMDLLAEGTGGRTCIGNNDLSDCVKKAMDDGSSYYELAYYPGSATWNGEFHRIVVKTSHPGVHLAYRQGYYALKEAGEAAHKDDAKRTNQGLRQAACDDLLTSTALLVFAEPMPPEEPGKARYYLAIDPSKLTFAPAEDGVRRIDINLAVCTFDRKGKALQYLTQRLEQKLDEKHISSLVSVPHVLQFPLGPDVSRLRLVVQDSASGDMGSVDIPYAASAPPAKAGGPVPGERKEE